MENKVINSQRSMNSIIKNICNIMRRSNCSGALQYVPELTWILFLRILDEIEKEEKDECEFMGVHYSESISEPYRWSDWASKEGEKRLELEKSELGATLNFVNNELIPYLKELKDSDNATDRQKIISEVLSNIENVRIDTEKNFLDVIEKVDEISNKNINNTHMFALSQVYEGLLLKMGEKANDGGQFFTPREVVRMIVKTINPKIGDKIYDPSCGTGGFLAEAYEYILNNNRLQLTSEQLQILKTETFYGREKENLIYPVALANLVLHGLDHPNIWHGNTLTGIAAYDGLFESAPELYDIILTNPPFGGKEGVEAQTNFAYKTSATQVLFLQHIIDNLKDKGKCGVVVDEGLLYRTNHNAFVETKKKLLEECNVWAIVSLPSGVFSATGAGVKTSILFFTKGEETKQIWYYDLSDINVTKKRPLLLEDFKEFFEMINDKAVGDNSWLVDISEIEFRNYDLKAINPSKLMKNTESSYSEIIDEMKINNEIINSILDEF